MINIKYASLLTASATTGWHDWLHGELWLFPDGLLRVRLGLLQTFLHGVGPTVDAQRMEVRNFDEQTFRALISQQSNLWIAREQIVQAYLHFGISEHRLLLHLVDGRKIKLLWLAMDNGISPLKDMLLYWLGDNFFILNSAFTLLV